MAEVKLFSEPEIALLKSTIVPQNATDDEIKLFIMICKKYNLDPFAKEIVMTKYETKYGAKTNFITTRDGYLKAAMQSEDFDGVVSFVVKEGDEFEIDAGKLEVRHKFGVKRGQILGAWAMAKHKKRPPVIVFVDFKEYYQDTPVWRQYPSAMIQKVAEVAALRRQFNISGLVAQEELGHQSDLQEEVTVQNQEPAQPVQLPPVSESPAKEDDKSYKATEKQLKRIYALMNEISKLSETPREELAAEIKQKYNVQHSNELTIEQASQVIEELQQTLDNLKSQPDEFATDVKNQLFGNQ